LEKALIWRWGLDSVRAKETDTRVGQHYRMDAFNKNICVLQLDEREQAPATSLMLHRTYYTITMTLHISSCLD
jgi:hypothetical protein